MISTDDLSKYKNNLWHYSLFSKADGKRHLSTDVSSSLRVNHWEWNEAACSFRKSNTTGYSALSYPQQFRPSTFHVKLSKRIKMLQLLFTKYADRREKYILVCLQQQNPPLKHAAILLNWRSTRVLQEGFVVAGEWEEGRGTFAACTTLQIHLLLRVNTAPGKSQLWQQEASTARTGWWHLLWYTNVQSRRKLISGCLPRSHSGNKRRFNTPRPAP